MSRIYQPINQYHGGGSVLHGTTTVWNVVSECKVHDLSDEQTNEVFEIIRNGGEVIILSGEIKAANYGVED